jgi:Tol biopolymer transport system component
MDLSRVLIARIGVVAGVVGCFAASAARAQDPVSRISVDPNGGDGDGQSGGSTASRLSADGRYVAFESDATNLVANDTNGENDIFVRDRATGTTVRVNVDSSGAEANGISTELAISDDGRFVAFSSVATNLVANDANGQMDVFVHDRDPDMNGVFDEGNGVTTRVSVSSTGKEGDGWSYTPAISADGNWVVFASDATTLVSSDTNGKADIFLHDRSSGTTTRVSLKGTGTQANSHSRLPAISADGAFVAFESSATNLVSRDNNGVTDIFVREIATSTTTRISTPSGGGEGNARSYGPPAFSSDGMVIAFASEATNLVTSDTNGFADVFVRDVVAGKTLRVSLDGGGKDLAGFSQFPAISADGNFVVYSTSAADAAPGDANGVEDVVVFDRTAGTNRIVSRNCVGEYGNDFSHHPAISADATIVSFRSPANNFVVGDGNKFADVFVRDLTVNETQASWSNYGAGWPGTLGEPTLVATAVPKFGSTIDLVASNSAGIDTMAYALFGFASASIPTNRGGTLLVDPFAVALVSVPVAGWQVPVGIPFDVNLCGLIGYAQLIEQDAGASDGLSFTAGLELVLGL